MITQALAILTAKEIPELIPDHNLFTEEGQGEGVVISTTNDSPDPGYNSLKPVTFTARIQIRIHGKGKSESFNLAKRITDTLADEHDIEVDGYYIYQSWLNNGVWIPRRVNGGAGFYSVNMTVRYRMV